MLKTFGGLPEGPVPLPASQAPARAAAAQAQPRQAQQGQAQAPALEVRPADVPIDKLRTPHGLYTDMRDPANPVILVADRSHNRIVRYSLDGKAINVVEGTRSPCHFHSYKDLVVVPGLRARVTLLSKDNKVVANLGDGLTVNPAGVRATEDRSNFIAGKFVAPHGAAFDHAGNIFIVEYVEIGRVTKLRKVS